MRRYMLSLYPSRCRRPRSKQFAHRSNCGRRTRQFVVQNSLEYLEYRITPTGNIVLTNAFVVDSNDQPLTTINAGQKVYIEGDFTTRGLPSNASYRVAYTVNGLTLDSSYITYGAGKGGTQSWYEYWGNFMATAGENQVTVNVDPDQSVPETSYADNIMNFSFVASTPAVGSLSYTVSQIRDAYGVNSIPDFGSATPDGSGQTIAIVDAFNDPNILTDLDGFDQGMNLASNSSQTLYQAYGAASSILTVYNQIGTDITSQIANSGAGPVPAVDPTGGWEGEETMDVEWAHAIAPGAHINLIETDGTGDFDDLFTGAATAAQLPGVTVMSMSWIWNEGNWSGSNGSGELAYDSSTFTTPVDHPGITFLASSGDGGTPGGYPAFSPNVVAVSATDLSLNGENYAGETAWSFPTPRTLDNGSTSYTQTGTWMSHSGGFSGAYTTAAAGTQSVALWTTSISSSDQGWVGGTEVSATWVPSAGNATNATYKIYDGTVTSGTLLGTVTVDQTQAPVGTSDGGAQFQELGDFYPQSGTLTVAISAKPANGTVVADAVGIAPAWATGGGQSQYELEPSFQNSVQSTGYRTTPDVAFDGSDSSGVTCYQGGFGYDYFGTSLSSPCWAGLIAVADQGRVTAGGAPFNNSANPMQALQALYSLPASDFNSITSGYNGLSASAGYDELTGRGSPIANLVVSDLVSYGLPAKLVITAQPNASVTAGGEFGLTVAVEDRLGNLLTNYSGSVTIALGANPGDDTLGGTLTMPIVNDTAMFSNLALVVADSGYTLSASSPGLTGAISDAVEVFPAMASKLVIESPPSTSATAGQALVNQPVIYEEDKYDNLETNDNSKIVTVSLGNGAGPLQGNTTAVVSDGVAAFSNLGDDKAETISLEFNSSGLTEATSNNIVVSPATPAKLVIGNEPSSTAIAGHALAIQPVIYEEDQYGNLEFGDSNTVVTASLGSGTGPLQGDTTAIVSGGVANFVNLGDDKAETISFEFNSAGLTGTAATNVIVGAGPPMRLVVNTQPTSTATAGQAFANQPAVYEEDQYGNLETTDSSTIVTAVIEVGSGPLQGSSTAAVSGGIATFSNLAYDKSETISLAFNVTGLAGATSTDIVVSPAAPKQLVIDSEPTSTATAGEAFANQPVIDEEDQYGNIETNDSGRVVTASLSSGTGPLQGTAMAVISGGIATFNSLADNTAETISLAFNSPGLTDATSANIVVSPAAPSKLVIHLQPSPTAKAGQAFAIQPTIYEEDQYGNIETTDNQTVVTAALASGSGPLQGTNKVTLSGGVANFTNLADKSAETVTLIFTTGALATTGASIPIVVTAPIPSVKSEKVVTKPSLGFAFQFTTPMNAATVGLASNYDVEAFSTKTVNKKTVKVITDVHVKAIYNQSSNTVTLTFIGKNPFSQGGGQIKILSTSRKSGVSSTAGVLLNPKYTVFTISAKGSGIKLG
jgi:hypothetical protein